MIQRKMHLILLSGLLGIGLLVSACSQIVVGPPGSGGSTASSMTALQVLQNSADAMKQLKSSHIDLQSNLQATGLVDSRAQPAPATAAKPGSFSLSIVGSGDQQLPDQEQLHLTINQSNVAEIVQGDKVYVQNAQGQWYVLDKSAFAGIVGNPFAGIHFDQSSLPGLITHAAIADHGTEALNGQNLRHISADLDKEALRQMLTDNPQIQGMLGQQNLDQLLNSTQSFLASIDVWIDETQFYVHRSQLKLNLTENTNGSNITVALNTVIDLSKFNAPVTITPPSGAIATTNPGAIIGLGQP